MKLVHVKYYDHYSGSNVGWKDWTVYLKENRRVCINSVGWIAGEDKVYLYLIPDKIEHDNKPTGAVISAIVKSCIIKKKYLRIK